MNAERMSCKQGRFGPSLIKKFNFIRGSEMSYGPTDIQPTVQLLLDELKSG